MRLWGVISCPRSRTGHGGIGCFRSGGNRARGGRGASAGGWSCSLSAGRERQFLQRRRGRRFPQRRRGGGMSVVFVPERLRGKAEVNQETLQRVSGRWDPWGAAREHPARLGPRRLCPALPPPSQPPSAAAREAGPRRAVTAVFAAAAGGERPADPLHRGVPEQGPRHRLRAVSASGRPRAGSRGRWGSAQPRPARR